MSTTILDYELDDANDESDQSDDSPTGGGDNDVEDSVAGDSQPGDSAPDKKGGKKSAGKSAKRNRAAAWRERRKQLSENVERAQATAAAIETGGSSLIKRYGETIVKGLARGDVTAVFKQAAGDTKFLLRLALIVFLILFSILVIFIMVIVALFSDDDETAYLRRINHTLTVTKTSDDTDGLVNPSQLVRYTIHAVSSVPVTNIKISDKLPAYTTLIDDAEFQQSKAEYDRSTRTLTWNTKNLPAPATPVDATVTFQVRVDSNVVPPYRIINFATATSEGASVSANMAALLPNPAPSDSSRGTGAKPGVMSRYSPELIAVYKQAAAGTGVPWQVLAGIHFREGLSLNTSLVSGREIGALEPDVPTTSCPSSNPQNVADGKAELRSGGGCKFSSLLDTAIYSGNHLIGKIGRIPQNFEDLVTAVSRYNGGGNRNCGRGSLAPDYKGPCPPPFFGHDDDYAMNLFDAYHDPMYIIYCADHTQCTSARLDQRPGVVTVIKWVATSNL